MSYDKGLLHGKKTIYTQKAEKCFEATYEKGKLQGKLFEKRADGFEVQQTFKDSQLNGECIVFYPAGPAGKIMAYQANYTAGLLDGEVTEYTQTGTKKSISFYKKGLRSGLQSYFDDEGKLDVTAEFQDGKQHGPMKNFFPDGKVAKLANFSNNMQQGEEICYFPSGQKGSIKHYKDGKLHGLSSEWNEKGVLVFEGEFQNGLKNGKFNKYSDTGEPIVLQTFSQDILVTKKSFN